MDGMNGLTNGGAPPSTLAAQIVDNLQRPYNQHDADPDLHDLLSEFLAAGSVAFSGTDIDTKCQLVELSIRACRKSLSLPNTHESNHSKQEKAIKYLQVTEASIRHAPDVLFHCHSFETTDGPAATSALFFGWVVPQLIVLLGDSQYTQISDGVSAILKAFQRAEDKPRSLKISFESVSLLVRCCARDLVESLRDVKWKQATVSDTRIPSKRTVVQFYPSAGLKEIRGLQTSPGGLDRIVCIVARLIAATLENLDTILSTRVILIKGLQDISELVVILNKIKQTSLLPSTSSYAYITFLKIIRQLMQSLAYSSLSEHLLDLVTRTFCHLAANLLRFDLSHLDSGLQHELCQNLQTCIALSKTSSANKSILARHFEQNLRFLVEQPRELANCSVDLQISVTLTYSKILGLGVERLSYFLQQFEDEKLKKSFSDALEGPSWEVAGIERAAGSHVSKRVRLSHDEPSSATSRARVQLLQEFTKLGIDVLDQDTGLLSKDAWKRIPKNQTSFQEYILGLISLSLCSQVLRASSTCGTCRLASLGQSEPDEEQRYLNNMFELLTQLVTVHPDQTNPTVAAPLPRLLALNCLQKLLAHSHERSHMDLSSSSMGKWCLSSLNSKSKGIRNAAGKVIQQYIKSHRDRDICRRNRVLALDAVRQLAAGKDITRHETCIWVLGQIADSKPGEDETNIILYRLVEYLGNKHPLLNSLAFGELLRLSKNSCYHAQKLFEPYWSSIAVGVVKDMIVRPSSIQRLSDLIEIPVEALIAMTKIYTIPYLVLTKKSDIIEKIAIAAAASEGSSASTVETCLNPEQLPSLLALLLLHAPSDHETFVLSTLSSISEELRNTNVSELIKSDPVKIAFEVFRATGDGTDRHALQAHGALAFIADRVQHRGPSSNRRSSRKLDSLGSFFENHSLAILKLLSDVVTEVHRSQILPERRRCLAGIRHMISISGDYAVGAAPQISACLRTAIANADLCEEGFDAWSVLLKTMSDITGLIEPTFALIQRRWNDFGFSAQRKAHDLLCWLLKERQDLIADTVLSLPSIEDIPLLSKIGDDIAKCKNQLGQKRSFETFAKRLESEDMLVVKRALEELEVYLVDQQDFLQSSSLAEEPDPIVSRIIQSLLDICVRCSSLDRAVAISSAKSLGLIGCLDATRVELNRSDREMIVTSNFTNRDETVDFIVFFLEEVLVKAFLASMNPRSQNFLGFAMQNLLEICNFKSNNLPRGLEEGENYQKWMSMSEDTRTVLTPFLTSRYTLLEGNAPATLDFPVYAPGKRHADWLCQLVYDFLRKIDGDNANLVFGICKRIVRGQAISIAAFLLPYVALNILVGGHPAYKHEIGQEFVAILVQPIDGQPQSVKDDLVLCSQDVFRTLDYFSRWVHRKKHIISSKRLPPNEFEQSKLAVQTVEALSATIPAEVMSKRAVECKNFSRGLFYWEQYIRQWRKDNDQRLKEEPQSGDFLYERLQDIYVQIDEPDGIEGTSVYLQLLNVEQQVLEHRKAGRWTAVQNWNEILLSSSPKNVDYQSELLTSLRESGQYDAIINQVTTMARSGDPPHFAKSYMIEACWSTSRWQDLIAWAPKEPTARVGGFSNGVGAALAALYEKRFDDFALFIENLRTETALGLSKSSTKNLQSCRESLFHLHALAELEMICDINSIAEEPSSGLHAALDRRLSSIGAFSSDKQYLLSIRRAAMQLSKQQFSPEEISSAWLTSARLYRKKNSMQQAFKAILHASKLGDQTAAMEHARLLWKEGHHKKAIQSLEGAIVAHVFEKSANTSDFDGDQTLTRSSETQRQQQNIMAAKAQLLRAKWVDLANQTQSESIIKQYQSACSLYTRWEKGHYCLGRHYNKILESEKLKPPAKQSQACITGDLAKHIIENYLRSMAYGAKYIYQTLPRILTLWCELGTSVEQSPDTKYGTDESFRTHVMKHRKLFFEATVSQLKKYIDRLPAFVFYTALNQTCARICHPNTKVYAGLTDIVVKVCAAHPQQALWTLLAMVRSTARDRMQRGQACVAKVQDHAKRSRNESNAAEIKILVTQGTKVTEQLLEVCNADLRKFPKRQSKVSIKEMGFSHRQASACKLVIPIQATLSANLPTATDTVNMRQHKAFSKDTITIQSFEDEVLLLSSLVRPRKVDVRGSDGRVYAILCKPKDDLRLDQRLLEFNTTIKRLLKKDAESSKRRLYVKTYAVTPLNEECGLIEWVEGLKTHRDIMLKIYANKGVSPDYRVISSLLDEAINDDINKFTDTISKMFPSVFYEWFIESFPDPETWYVARMRYTRTCAVMSMVGHVLGLGDRHSENIMIEEGSGGIIHVDFNCLFDKGLTFEKPEMVPFRLTANMVDAFGAYGYEGPFRKACELTMAILRQHEDALMTVLEQFLYDPTIELMGGRKKKPNIDVPNTPEGVLESVRNKVRGLLPKEAIPLSVEGHVEHLIQQARDPERLARMYIGWCAFL